MFYIILVINLLLSVASSVDYNLHGVIEKGYYVEILVGTPPQKLNFVIDTGSSNIAVAAAKNPFVDKYYRSNESSTHHEPDFIIVSLNYTDGFWKGKLVSDIISIPTAGINGDIKTQLVEIDSYKNFFIEDANWQGIFGMAYPAIAQPGPHILNTVMSDIQEQTTSILDIFSLELCCPPLGNFSENTFGSLEIGKDPSDYTSDIFWTRIVHAWYYEVVITGVKINNVTIDLPCTSFNDDKSIVDSGTTNLRFPTKVYDEVLKNIKQNVPESLASSDYDQFWNGQDIICWSKKNNISAFFPDILIYLPSANENQSFYLTVTPQHYLLYSKNITNEAADKICFKFGVSPSETGSVLGAVVMEHYAVIFNRVNSTIGFTKSSCDNLGEITAVGGYVNGSKCAVKSKGDHFTTIQIVSYVVLGLFLLLMLPICVMLCMFLVRKDKSSDIEFSDTSNLINDSAFVIGNGSVG